MASIEIKIQKSDVLKRVRRATGYVGKKDESGKVSYENTAALTSDEEMLTEYWNEACSSITDVLKPFLSVAVEKGDTYKAVCSMPPSWNACTDYEETAVDYAVAYIIGRWMRLVKSDEEAKYMKDAEASMLLLRRKVYDKRKPKLI